MGVIISDRLCSTRPQWLTVPPLSVLLVEPLLLRLLLARARHQRVVRERRRQLRICRVQRIIGLFWDFKSQKCSCHDIWEHKCNNVHPIRKKFQSMGPYIALRCAFRQFWATFDLPVTSTEIFRSCEDFSSTEFLSSKERLQNQFWVKLFQIYSWCKKSYDLEAISHKNIRNPMIYGQFHQKKHFPRQGGNP